MTQPIQAVQICYEHPFGAEREVLREFFSFVGCLVKTTIDASRNYAGEAQIACQSGK